MSSGRYPRTLIHRANLSKSGKLAWSEGRMNHVNIFGEGDFAGGRKIKHFDISKSLSRTTKEYKSAYIAIHVWVSKTLGRPSRCSSCSEDGLSGGRIHWANISGYYLREIKDWVRLCAKCHSRYDRGLLTVSPINTRSMV